MREDWLAAAAAAVVEVSVDARSWALPRPFASARSAWDRREALVLRVADAAGFVGVGEAAPLPGYSPDTIEQAGEALELFASARLPPAELRSASPAAAFAVETALADLAARRRGMALDRFVADALDVRGPGATSTLTPVELAAVVDDLPGARRAAVLGYRVVKVKIGRDLEAELALARAIRSELGLAIRFDANGTLSGRLDVLADLADLDPEYVEEPAPWEELVTFGSPPVPIALDETLQRGDAARCIAGTPRLVAVVLKPTVVGGFARCAWLAERARAEGAEPIVSHTLEGPIATHACCALALALGSTRAAGLAPPSMAEAPAAVPASSFPAVTVAPIGGRQWSAEALDRRIRLVAVRLVSALQGRSGRRAVAWTARREVDDVVLFLAAIRAGVTAVPVHPSWTDAEVHAYLRRIDPAVVLASARSIGRGSASDLAAPTIVPETPACIVATSGSSGRPKACKLGRRGLVAAADASAEVVPLGPHDRWLLSLPLAHVGGLSVVIRCARAGATVVLDDAERFDPVRFLSTVRDQRITVVSLVPTMLRRVVELDVPPPPCLRAVLVGGAAADPELLCRARARGLPVLPTYGLTETCSQVATRPLGDAGDDTAIGPPLPGTELRIVDAEIQVRGFTIFDGYVDDPSPLLGGFLRTGDAGAIDADGRLRVFGRLDERIVSGGENVDPVEVEAVLRSVDGVADACVVGVPDPEWGQAVVAAIVGDAAPKDLSSALRRDLASYKRPKRIERLATLPSNATGKTDRRAVARLLSRG